MLPTDRDNVNKHGAGAGADIAGGGRRWNRLALSLLAVIALAGCAGPAEPEAAKQQAKGDWRIVDEVYSHIYERYIDPVSLDEVTLGGLKGLSGIDSNLDVKREGGAVWLIANNKSLAEFPLPRQNDSRGWSALTVAVLEAGRKASAKLRDAPTERLYEAVFDSALAGLDRFSRYATAEEASDHRAFRDGFGGVGIRIRMEDGMVRVVSVTPDMPADLAGVRAKDIIARIEGEPTTGLKLRQIIKRLRGRRGTMVKLSITRDNEAQPIEMMLVRRHVVPSTVIAQQENGVLHIRLSRFNQRTAATLATAVNQAREELGSGLRGLVLDLRNNPGGLLDQAVRVSDLFLDSGRIVTTEGRHPGSFQRYDARQGDILEGRPIVVLVNGRSASSSEIVAAALQDLGRAVIVGSNSYGKGTVQSVFRLRNSGELTLTWSRFHAPSGYALHNLGVMPSVCTSGLKESARETVDRLRRGQGVARATFTAWRAHRLPDKKGASDLRATCPSSVDTGGEKDVELEVARMVIADASLYARARIVAPTGDDAQRAQGTAGNANAGQP